MERNLGMEATTEDFDNSEPLGWECNVEVCVCVRVYVCVRALSGWLDYDGWTGGTMTGVKVKMGVGIC